MPNPNSQRITDLRALIADFLQKRLNDRLEKLAKENTRKPDKSYRSKVVDSRRMFEKETWLADAARRVVQIQTVTHSLKPIHPDAKGTNLYCPPQELPKLNVVGSHCLDKNFEGDVVGNASALDIHKFLKLAHQGRSLLALVLARDPDLATALSSDPTKSNTWINAFAGLIEQRGRAASHTLAKQLYWLIGNDPHNDADYHLLAPLYASSLAHHVYQTVQDDRFGDAAKAARDARKAGEFSDRPVHEYPQLAIQQLGGTNPQNISQLNSERRGNNLLLASLPPTWRSGKLKPLLNTDSMFTRYAGRPEVRQLVKTLLAFLKSDPAGNAETRAYRAELVDALIDEFLQFSAELGTLPPGWSQSNECRLGRVEKHWLDPDGVAQDCAVSGLPLPTDTDGRISSAFANWLNAQLRASLPMGDPEFLKWRTQMVEQIRAEEREAE